MSTIRYTITINGGDLAALSHAITAQVMPLVSQAVRAVAGQAAADWTEAVHRAKLWSGEKDAYVQTIKVRHLSDFASVVEADYRHAAEIETGRPPRDLKKMLDTSMKVRRTEGGKRFLVIPFRHNTAGNSATAQAVPGGVQKLADGMATSRVVKQTQRQSGEVTHLSPTTGMHAAAKQSPFLSNPKTKQAAMVAKNNYAWGGRITDGMLKSAGMTPEAVKRYSGMVKMDTSTPGGSKSSALMTFRIMMEGATGKWIIPAQPGLFLTKKVAQDLQPKAEQAFQAAIKKTIGG